MRKLLALLLLGHRDLKKIGTELERIADLIQLHTRGASPGGGFRTFYRDAAPDAGFIGYYSDEVERRREEWRTKFRIDVGREPYPEEEAEAEEGLSRAGFEEA